MCVCVVSVSADVSSDVYVGVVSVSADVSSDVCVFV